VKTFFLTTPLYYVNDVPHIGHAYTTIAADVLARWKRLKGEPVFFLTGTDEHGAKIDQAAQAAGKTPRAFADQVVGSFQALWKRLGITQDDFIRTTEERHARVVQGVFDFLLKKGDIYLGTYEDWYCVSCESFWTEAELADKTCPTCGRPVERLKEESYFFKLSSYEKPLLDHFEKNKDFLQPPHRASEIVNFVRSGLKDLSVSRTKVAWGVPVPSNPKHTVYVWFDALLNYISATGYAPGKKQAEGLWPADVHLVGKEIFRFHTVIWPAMLMALGLPLPKKVFAHGWWTVEGEKMSKSRGNVVDPRKMADEYGVDAFRYFLLREVPFGSDGDFSENNLLGRYNAELANGLGNLLNRTLNLLEKNHQGKIPGDPPAAHGGIVKMTNDAVERLAFHEALGDIFSLVNEGNKIIDQEAPWKTAKTDLPRAHQTLFKVVAILKEAALLLHPFMPSLTREMWKQLGEEQDLEAAGKDYLARGVLVFSPGQVVKKGPPLFPRKEVDLARPPVSLPPSPHLLP